MESTKPKSKKSPIDYANITQSLHIGCNGYENLRMEEFKNLQESYNDVNKYCEFFKIELQYDRSSRYTDETKSGQKDARKRILQSVDQMLSACTGIGKNPYVVNVITFSGHSIRCEGETIFVVPEISVGGENRVARFINVSELARKFAQTKYILSIFIMNTSTIPYQNNDIPMEGSEESSPFQ